MSGNDITENERSGKATLRKRLFSKKLVVVTTIFLLTCLGANAYPGIIICALANSSEQVSTAHRHLLNTASARIDSQFGAPQATPVVLFFDSEDEYWPLHPNTYGSTSFIGAQSCVIIGPHGQNIDVTAHELMHAEIAHRTGYWRRWAAMPIWFDEGLAMQVDFRPRYELTDDAPRASMASLQSGRDFFVADDERLTHHYASARAEVADWINSVGAKNVYTELNKFARGEPFSDTVESRL